MIQVQRKDRKRVMLAILLMVGLLGVVTETRTTEAAKLIGRTSEPGFVQPMGGVIVEAFSVTGGTPSPSDNDYTRINIAVQAAVSGSQIELHGVFNWTEANAAASWALGSDGVVSPIDDFSILVPAGLTDLTITASSLGAATIEGPGDLASVNLEAFLILDGGDNQNFRVTNLRIRNFDLAIGMFNGAGGADAFSDTILQNNYILVPSDLNTVVAPADANQNIGIHFSWGANQHISGNTIEFEGTGVSDIPSSSSAASVGMQSNTSGGDVYNGLLISNNTLRVLNAQSAAPETILGIWENGFAHSSNITVSDNDFINAAPGNDPQLNVQRAFRVTSHSSATTTVTFSNNTATGSSTGFQWIGGEDFSGNQPVRLTGNTLIDCVNGILIQSNGVAAIIGNTITGNTTGVSIADQNPTVSLSFNRIVGNGVGVASAGAGLINAENNWWGCNAGPGGTGCDTATGNVDFNPWLVLTISAAPTSVSPGGTSAISASLTRNSDGVDTSGSGNVPDGTTVTFASSPQGTVAPPVALTGSGAAASVFTAGPLPGVATVSATVDSQTVMINITIAGVVGDPSIICIQDESNGNFILFNTTTGDYTFTRCSTGFMLSGIGTVTTTGCSVRLTHNSGNRRLTATIDRCQKKGIASIQTFGPSATFTIIDRNTTNNTCACAL